MGRMRTYKASEVFTPEEARFCKFILKVWEGKIVSVTEIGGEDEKKKNSKGKTTK